MKKSSILGVEQQLRLFHFSFGIPDENNSATPFSCGSPFRLVVQSSISPYPFSLAGKPNVLSHNLSAVWMKCGKIL